VLFLKQKASHLKHLVVVGAKALTIQILFKKETPFFKCSLPGCVFLLLKKETLLGVLFGLKHSHLQSSTQLLL